MLLVAFQLKEPLFYIEKNTTHAEFQKIALNGTDWFIIENLIKIFEIFVKPSTKLQGQVYVTLSTALLYIYKVYNELFELQQAFQAQLSQNTASVSYNLFNFLYS